LLLASATWGDKNATRMARMSHVRVQELSFVIALAAVNLGIALNVLRDITDAGLDSSPLQDWLRGCDDTVEQGARSVLFDRHRHKTVVFGDYFRDRGLFEDGIAQLRSALRDTPPYRFPPLGVSQVGGPAFGGREGPSSNGTPTRPTCGNFIAASEYWKSMFPAVPYQWSLLLLGALLMSMVGKRPVRI